jgi:predicted O-methyltransferase YrrM
METRQPSKDVVILAVLVAAGLLAGTVVSADRHAQSAGGAAGAQAELDARVRAFLDSQRGRWRDMNVPAVDGQTLHDLIVEHNYTRALEIGTSTGHSGIWIAWALSKTGGRLITIDIDERRHRQAVANFEAAGLSHLIDARLGDAHTLVPALEGPFDFVFSDADKEWYRHYFDAVLPKLVVGGRYATHNVSPGRGRRGNSDYLDYLRTVPGVETTVDTRGAGLAISFKRAQGSGKSSSPALRPKT